MGAYSYSGTAGSNTTVDGIASQGTSDANLIDDLVRALAAGQANFVRDLGGPTAGGSANALTVALNDATTLPAYFDGMVVGFIAASDNDSTTVTLNVDSVGAKAVKVAAAGVEALPAVGAIQAGGYYLARYRSAWASAAGAFQLIDLNQTSDQFIQVGTVVDYAGSTAPSKWLMCYGQAISRTTYASLFAVISTTYGVGDGSSTFNLPDLRGRVVAGKDDMGGSSANRLTDQTDGLNGDTLGASGGAETHTLTEAQMPLHGHPFRTGFNASGSQDALGGFTMEQGGTQTSNAAFTGTVSSTLGEQIGGTGGGTAHNNVQPTFILNKIIYAGA